MHCFSLILNLVLTFVPTHLLHTPRVQRKWRMALSAHCAGPDTGHHSMLRGPQVLLCWVSRLSCYKSQHSPDTAMPQHRPWGDLSLCLCASTCTQTSKALTWIIIPPQQQGRQETDYGEEKENPLKVQIQHLSPRFIYLKVSEPTLKWMMFNWKNVLCI